MTSTDKRVDNGGPAIELWRHSMGFQICTKLGGVGWRMSGPKFDGTSKLVKRVRITEHECNELENFVERAREMLRARKESRS